MTTSKGEELRGQTDLAAIARRYPVALLQGV